ncbi:ABC transporter ATP-binding protein [Brevibacillus sp. Leaf182]|uniref:ABC transporter ATP-binding protein n=1 Tax=Brevibacillus sp. Leaf182 TaxID=1736290 RepID=UPI0006F50746|nr:ABC transporter ATP-binding protein [Brevibacillus sp. Leaf182]RAT99534.1 ABC transporter ATP-binding protein [Brevibacillus sp. Leaf182]
MAQLSIHQLSKRYKTGEGVSDISLEVQKGELISLLGPSGCGKTTVLRSIGGFLDPEGGDIRIKGQSILSMPPEKRPTAMVFQSYNLWPHMTVYENLAFGLKIRKRKKEDIHYAVTRALEMVRLSGAEKKYPTELSGGQQQRIALARALLLEPEVLLLDEPFSALDAKLRLEMREELREIQAATGMTMVFVTHDQEEALSISDRIVVMNAGKIEQLATPKELYDHPATLFVASFIGRMNFLKGVADGGEARVEGLDYPLKTDLSGNVILAVRPEEVQIRDEHEAGMQATVRQIMMLGHYAEISLDTQHGIVKSFLPREKTEQLQQGQSCKVHVGRTSIFSD